MQQGLQSMCSLLHRRHLFILLYFQKAPEKYKPHRILFGHGEVYT
ncbi:hypothetical protein [Pontibacter mucosus]|nr:hypothetical protein [Pontibacter mucosus]